MMRVTNIRTILRVFLYSPISIVLMALLWPQWVFAAEWEPLVADLRSDHVRFNARRASGRLYRLIDRENPPGLREKLENLLEDTDHQMRQYASYLLVMDIYRKERVPESQWPEALMRNMVEGLRTDQMRGGSTFSNADAFVKPLLNLKENRPTELLRAELAGSDPQSRSIAVILLARYGDELSLPEINKILLSHLSDDKIHRNAVVAYRTLVWSGAENIRQLAKSSQSLDWQQAALIQCVASFHGVGSPFFDDAIRERWLEEAGQLQPYVYGAERKFAMAALYLDPQRERFLRGKKVPEALDRMLKAGRNVEGAANRMKWVISWFPILDPENRLFLMSLHPI